MFGTRNWNANSSAHRELAEPHSQPREAERKLPPHYARHYFLHYLGHYPRRQWGCWARHLRQNMRAVREERLADRWGLRGSFCDAASGRASIYACKAFNTEERVGSIGEARENHPR